jgi:hypothetical protein
VKVAAATGVIGGGTAQTPLAQSVLGKPQQSLLVVHDCARARQVVVEVDLQWNVAGLESG